VTAYLATSSEGCDFSCLELDCDPVLIAFSNGREIGRTYDVAEADDWVRGLVSEEDSRVEDTP
jgi:hypothetical protein